MVRLTKHTNGVNRMTHKKSVDIRGKVLEIERMLAEFKEKFEAGTTDAEHFMTMSEIERLWGELRNNTDNMYSGVLRDLMASVNEADLIRKKKENTETKE